MQILNNFFEGCYYKHQKDDQVLCLIAGTSRSEHFIQIINRNFSVQAPFSPGNLFSNRGIRLDIHTKDLSLEGHILYRNLSPIKYDIMDPFQYFPMECRHRIISMHHDLQGNVLLNGGILDFTAGFPFHLHMYKL